LEPVGEDVPAIPRLSELVEAAQAEEGVADDQQRPALADDPSARAISSSALRSRVSACA
jgi:hypothetical protein